MEGIPIAASANLLWYAAGWAKKGIALLHPGFVVRLSPKENLLGRKTTFAGMLEIRDKKLAVTVRHDNSRVPCKGQPMSAAPSAVCGGIQSVFVDTFFVQLQSTVVVVVFVQLLITCL